MRNFQLSEQFLEEYKNKIAPWGYGALSYLTYKRSYARKLENGKTEEWWQTVQRVVEGVFSIQKKHCSSFNLEWDNRRAQKSAQVMYDKIFNFKMLPPGRGLWAAGTEIIDKVGGLALTNCCNLTTEHIDTNFSEPFCTLMDFSMLGCGVGHDTKGAGKVKIQIKENQEKEIFVVPDSREGWVECLKKTLDYYQNGKLYDFDYSLIRPAGSPIKTFGGVAPGPEPLRLLVKEISSVLTPLNGKPITSVAIVDIMDMIGKCVVSGNVRRSAIISLGNLDDKDFIEMKDPVKYEKELQNHRWCSNNSVFANIGDDYTFIEENIKNNGEPGLVFIDNAKSFGRRKDGIDKSDYRVNGPNPCVTGDTEILTDRGYVRIDSVLDEEINVWNGEEFTPVIPQITGKNVKTLKVILSDGTELKCTINHNFILKGGIKKEAQYLEIGDKLEKFSMPIIKDGIDYSNLYTQGFYSAEGITGKNYLFLYWTKYMCGPYLEGKVGKELQQKRKFVRLSKQPLSKEFVPVDGNINSKLTWFAGLLDGDGCELKEGGAQISSINKEFLLNTKKMLSTLGVPSKVVPGRKSGLRNMPDGRGGKKQYLCKDCWRLCIGSVQIQSLIKLGLKTHRLVFKKNPQRDASQFVRISKLEYLGIEPEVYCFTEPKTNRGCFEGVVTGQCGEIILEPNELCNLGNVYPAHHDSLEEFLDTLKYIYLYCKTITLVPTHNTKTNAVIMRNRRIGISLAGVQQAINKFGRRKFLNGFCDKGYTTLKYWDKIYSEWLGVPMSIRITTEKPDGSTALLAGAFPGVHMPHAKRYIRNVRFDKDSQYIAPLKKAGYLIEDDYYDKYSVVVSFPIQESNYKKSKFETSMLEQFKTVSDMQHYWADNAVSCTITFNEKEKNDIADILSMFETELKTVSLLPLKDHQYIQAPYIEVVGNDKLTDSKRFKKGYKLAWTEQEFEEYKSKINEKVLYKEIAKLNELDDGIGEKFCNNDTCEIKLGE